MKVISAKIMENYGNSYRQGMFEIALVAGYASISPSKLTLVFDTIAIDSFEERLGAGAKELSSLFSFSFCLSLSNFFAFVRKSYDTGFEFSKLTRALFELCSKFALLYLQLLSKCTSKVTLKAIACY